VTPAARRQAVALAQQECGLSRRHACRLIGISRSVVEREQRRERDHARLRERLRALAGERRRFGYRRLHELLRREGWAVNHKLIHRLYREEELVIRRRGRQKRGLGGVMAGSWCPIAANQRWSLDFTEDCLASGRKFRTANLKDDCTRECPAILVDFSLPGRRVVEMLEGVARERGYPDLLVVDNGPELRGRELDRWAHDHGVKLFFIDPGKPMQNASIESFNGRFREECLDPTWFTSLAEARRVIEGWRIDYNEHRPHTSLRMGTPAAFAAARPFVKRPRQRPAARELPEGSPPEAVAVLTAPVLSDVHGFP
jgi:putative transposase